MACPRGHYVTEEGYEENEVRTLLKSGGVLRVFCPTCDEHWDANDEQRAMLNWALGWR